MAQNINQQELLDNVIELQEKVQQARKHLDTLRYELIKANEAFAASWNDCYSPFVYGGYLVSVQEEWWDWKDRESIVTVEPVQHFTNLITK